MRTLLLAGAASASALVLSASLETASAVTIGFTGQIVNYTVPNTGIYQISATGAEGGTEPYSVFPDAYGARGEGIRAYFDLTAGEVLQIAVGGKGGDGPGSGQYGAAGGGGGTFVIGPNNTPLLIAGGGGGGGAESGSDGVNPSGLSATNGASGSGPGGSAGSNGSGGNAGGGIGTGGGGGGGFLGNGGSSSGAAGGNSFANGPGGGGSGTRGGGGFGGGGAGRQGSQGGGGGGGGYNGGGGGGGGTAIDGRGSNSNGGGGSGGSFIGNSDPDLPSYFDAPGLPSGVGNGSVTIYDLTTGFGSPAPASVPEPASLALFGTALAGLGLIRRRQRR